MSDQAKVFEGFKGLGESVFGRRRFQRLWPWQYRADARIAIAQEYMYRVVGNLPVGRDLSPQARREALALYQDVENAGTGELIYCGSYEAICEYHEGLEARARSHAPKLIAELEPTVRANALQWFPWGWGYACEIVSFNAWTTRDREDERPRGLDPRERPDQDAQLLYLYLTGQWADYNVRRRVAREWGLLTGDESPADEYDVLYHFHRSSLARVGKAKRRRGVKRPPGRPRQDHIPDVKRPPGRPRRSDAVGFS